MKFLMNMIQTLQPLVTETETRSRFSPSKGNDISVTHLCPRSHQEMRNRLEETRTTGINSSKAVPKDGNADYRKKYDYEQIMVSIKAFKTRKSIPTQFQNEFSRHPDLLMRDYILI